MQYIISVKVFSSHVSSKIVVQRSYQIQTSSKKTLDIYYKVMEEHRPDLNRQQALDFVKEKRFIICGRQVEINEMTSLDDILFTGTLTEAQLGVVFNH